MVKIILTTMVVAITTLLVNAQDNFKIDLQETNISWYGEKIGGSHEGIINLKSGTLNIKGGKLIGGTFVIDMKSLTNTDLEGEYKKKLEDHLKSDDFFGVAKFPEATLKITKVKEKTADEYTIDADLTIKGKTKSVNFDAILNIDGGDLVAEAEITVNRANYDVKYGSKTFFDNLGDKVIYDNFILSVSLLAKK